MQSASNSHEQHTTKQQGNAKQTKTITGRTQEHKNKRTTQRIKHDQKNILEHGTNQPNNRRKCGMGRQRNQTKPRKRSLTEHTQLQGRENEKLIADTRLQGTDNRHSSKNTYTTRAQQSTRNNQQKGIRQPVEYPRTREKTALK